MYTIIEIRPGEGGADARALVREQARLYVRLGEASGVVIDVVEEDHG